MIWKPGGENLNEDTIFLVKFIRSVFLYGSKGPDVLTVTPSLYSVIHVNLLHFAFGFPIRFNRAKNLSSEGICAICIPHAYFIESKISLCFSSTNFFCSSTTSFCCSIISFCLERRKVSPYKNRFFFGQSMLRLR
jgi:hypothetical protein